MYKRAAAASGSSAALKHLVEVGQVGDLQHGAVLAEAFRGTEESSERFEQNMFHIPAPGIPV